MIIIRSKFRERMTPFLTVRLQTMLLLTISFEYIYIYTSLNFKQEAFSL